LRGLYVIVNEGAIDPVALTERCLDAGVTIVQYRAKNGIDAGRLRALRIRTRERGALLILNDDCNAAVAFDCDGVHLGPDDGGFYESARVRALLGDRIVGLSCGTVEEARAADPASIDYIGIGPVFATGSKADAGEPIGIAGLQRVAAASVLPVAAIGGIDASNIASVAQAGVAMAAVISAVANDPEPRSAATRLMELWSGARGERSMPA
jgi:thiamine-phosphate pyrophosphorylase